MVSVNARNVNRQVYPLRIARGLMFLIAFVLIAMCIFVACVAFCAWLLGMLGLGISTDTRFLMATMMISSALIISLMLERYVADVQGHDDDCEELEPDDEMLTHQLWEMMERTVVVKERDNAYHIVETGDADEPILNAAYSRKSSPNRRQRRKLNK